MLSITIEQARQFLITYHHLDRLNELFDEAGILQYFKKVGCIQYDPLNVVGRNADLVLQSRIVGYQPKMLESLLYEKRSLIDGWDKMMSIYQQKDWPYFTRIREAMKQEIQSTLAYRNSLEAIEMVDEIIAIMLEKGPTQAKDISIGATYSGSWGHKKMSSAALDYMYHIGKIGVHTKKNTQKVYDVIESLISSELLKQGDPFNDDAAFDAWYIKRRIGSIGLLWGKSGGGWLGYRLSQVPLRTKTLQQLVEKDELIEVQIESLKEVFYLRKEEEALLNHIISQQKSENEQHSENLDQVYQSHQLPQIRILAPLDNLLWDRGMIEQLFGFSYTWEVYVPVVKRKYGYYVLPVMYGHRFIARFEPELQRKKEPLRIKQWWWEENIEKSPEMYQAIFNGLENFCRYLGAESYVLPADFTTKTSIDLHTNCDSDPLFE